MARCSPISSGTRSARDVLDSLTFEHDAADGVGLDPLDGSSGSQPERHELWIDINARQAQPDAPVLHNAPACRSVTIAERPVA